MPALPDRGESPPDGESRHSIRRRRRCTTFPAAKQAVGALTGNKATKREGERQERKGEVKGHIDDAAEKAQDATSSLKDKLKDAVDKA